jgi:hypothetical protein
MEGLGVHHPAAAARASRSYWEAGDLIGPGKVVALDLLPDGLLVEFGTFLTDQERATLLPAPPPAGRHMVPGGLHPGAPGLALHRDRYEDRPHELGTMHVLLNRTGGDGTKWWLGEIASWGKGVKNIGLGAKDTAEALAQAPGVVAVCGAQNRWPMDIDAAAWLHRPNQPVEAAAV